MGPNMCKAITTRSRLRRTWWWGCLLILSGCGGFAAQGVNVDGVRLYQQGMYDQAAERFREAIAYDANDADAYYNLGAVVHRTASLQGDPTGYRRAEGLYNQCLERDPNHVECYRGLAVLLVDTDRTDAAFRLMEGWQRAAPHSADPKIEIARLLEEQGQEEDAKAQLVEALALNPHSSRALTALGQLHERSGNPLQALADYQRSLEVNAMQPQVQSRIATLQGIYGTQAVRPPTDLGETRTVQQPSVRHRY